MINNNIFGRKGKALINYKIGLLGCIMVLKVVYLIG